MMFEHGAGCRGPAVQLAPPQWAVAMVRCCVVGVLLLPVVAPAVLVGGSLLLGASGERFRMAGMLAAFWLGMFLLVLAETLTTHFPPVPRP